MLASHSTLLCCFLFQIASSNPQNVIHVGIDGFRTDRGQVICSLYSSAEGFPKNYGKAIAHSKSRIANRHTDCEFAGIQPGTYAVAVFHDENSNGRLDANFLGIPREGVGRRTTREGTSGRRIFMTRPLATRADRWI